MRVLRWNEWMLQFYYVRRIGCVVLCVLPSENTIVTVNAEQLNKPSKRNCFRFEYYRCVSAIVAWVDCGSIAKPRVRKALLTNGLSQTRKRTLCTLRPQFNGAHQSPLSAAFGIGNSRKHTLQLYSMAHNEVSPMAFKKICSDCWRHRRHWVGDMNFKWCSNILRFFIIIISFRQQVVSSRWRPRHHSIRAQRAPIVYAACMLVFIFHSRSVAFFAYRIVCRRLLFATSQSIRRMCVRVSVSRSTLRMPCQLIMPT